MPFRKEKKRFDKRPAGKFGKPAFGRDRPSFGGDRPSYGADRSFGDRPAGRNSNGRGGFELFKARCETCGNDCEVPFKPTSGKPIYCRDCFKKNDDAGSRKSFNRQESKSGVSAEDLQEINRKLDLIMEALDIE